MGGISKIPLTYCLNTPSYPSLTTTVYRLPLTDLFPLLTLVTECSYSSLFGWFSVLLDSSRIGEMEGRSDSRFRAISQICSIFWTIFIKVPKLPSSMENYGRSSFQNPCTSHYILDLHLSQVKIISHNQITSNLTLNLTSDISTPHS